MNAPWHLGRRRDANIVTATGNCPCCGRALSDEWENVGLEDVPPSSGKLSLPEAPAREEFIHATRMDESQLVKSFALSWLMMMMAGLFLWNALPSYKGVIAGGSCFVFLFAILLKSDRRKRRCCPHCGSRVDAIRSIVIATGNCPFCGKSVLPEEPRS